MLPNSTIGKAVCNKESVNAKFESTIANRIDIEKRSSLFRQQCIPADSRSFPTTLEQSNKFKVGKKTPGFVSLAVTPSLQCLCTFMGKHTCKIQTGLLHQYNSTRNHISFHLIGLFHPKAQFISIEFICTVLPPLNT